MSVKKRVFEVTSENNYYHGDVAALVRETDHEVELRIDTGNGITGLIFDKSEVEER